MEKRLKTCMVLIIIASFLFGICFIFFQKPLSWYDEFTHFARSIELSHGDFMERQGDSNIWIGGEIDEGEQIFMVYAGDGGVGFSHRWITAFQDIERTGNSVFQAVTNTITNHPIVYFPYIIAAWLSALFNLKPIYELYLMRLLGLICFFGIYLFAVRKTQKARLPLILFLLSPFVILTFASVTADAYLISISVLFFVILFEKLDMIKDGCSFGRKDYIEIEAVTILMSFCKMPNFLMIGLWLPVIYFAIQSDKALYQKFNRTAMISVCFAAVITIAFFLLVKDTNSGKFWGRNVDTLAQISNMLAHPMDTIKRFVYGILNYSSFFVIQTGYLKNSDLMVPFWIAALFYVGVFFSAKDTTGGCFIDESESEKFRLFDICSYIISFVFLVFVFLMLYLQFSEIGSSTIEGVQSRYFLPVIFLMLFIYVYHKPKIMRNYLVFSVVLCVLPLLFYLPSQAPA